jgi:glycosyltransferase involved in cell wall biosynthesis
MRVLHVFGHRRWSAALGTLRAAVKAQILGGDQVWVATPDRTVAKRFRALGASAVQAPLWFGREHPLDVVPLIWLYRLCRQLRFDLVATHGFKGGVLGRVAARLAGVPRIIHHATSYRFLLVKPGLRRRYYVAIEKLAGRAGDLVITATEEQRQQAIRAGVTAADRVVTVRGGVGVRPPRAARLPAGQDLAGVEGETVIGCAGCLSWERGVQYLLQAMPAILARHPGARLVMVGSGPLEEELRTGAALAGVGDRVEFTGDRDDLSSLLARCHLFVDASLGAGPAANLLEAMGAGCAIVATNTPQHRELVEHGRSALLVAPGSSHALAEAINTLLDQPALARKLAAAAQQAALRCSREQAAAELLRIYGREPRPPQGQSSPRLQEFFQEE